MLEKLVGCAAESETKSWHLRQVTVDALLSAGSATTRLIRQREILSKLRGNDLRTPTGGKKKTECLTQNTAFDDQSVRLRGEHKQGIEFVPTWRTLSHSRCAAFCFGLKTHKQHPGRAKWVSISENSNAIWNGRFRRQSKSQSEAVHWGPYFTVGILNLREEDENMEAGCWVYHTSHILRKILHFSFTCETKIDIMLIYSTRPDGGLIPKCVKSRTAFPLSL